jgi:hypothetical protein
MNINSGPFQTQFELLVHAIKNSDKKLGDMCTLNLGYLYQIFYKRGLVRMQKNQSIWGSSKEVPPDTKDLKKNFEQMSNFFVWLFGWHGEENGLLAQKKYALFYDTANSYKMERDRLRKEKRVTSDALVDLECKLEILGYSLGKWMDRCAP